ncbi:MULTISPECIES: hypothetical protein [Selenomonas]|uniref:hypothetical protein n=2 Tax=Selenomonadaceae TaxID=1843491 RepID=UPI00027A5D5E|nr:MULTISPECIES: hypothetical protein [Selenomonas]EJP28991.1 hypothetical protein HMPREF1147_0037 [Selenomonas sp. FOBRC9]
MNEWKTIQLDHILAIEKCVGEYNVEEELETPWCGFKVKIFERQTGGFHGYTNIILKDSTGEFEQGKGEGATAEEAFINTVQDFFSRCFQKGTTGDNITFAAFDDIAVYDF